jgi:hypothetical protein
LGFGNVGLILDLEGTSMAYVFRVDEVGSRAATGASSPPDRGLVVVQLGALTATVRYIVMRTCSAGEVRGY